MIAKTETLGGCKILRVSGRIDFESALDFEQQINAMIQEAGDGYIIELSQVELLSSAGLRVMLSTAKRVAHRNASLALAAPSQVVRQVFEISHFNLLFKIFPSVPAAIAALKGTSGVAQMEETTLDSLRSPGLTGHEEARSTDLIVPSAQPAARPPLAEKLEATRPEPVPSVSQPPPKIEAVRPIPPVISQPPPTDEVRSVSVGSSMAAPQPPAVPRSAETPTVAPPPLPPAIAEPRKTPPATAMPSKPQAGPARQTPPPLPAANPSAPASLAPAQAPVARPGSPVTRREAKYPALLEVRAEGASYPCKDGDVIGTEGRVALPYFSQIAHLAPRHLLIGQLEGHWFVFTPKNVQHPFILDGVALRAGERKILQYVEHQVEFSGHVFGFRLVAQQPKEGFFSRLFGRKP
jgi:anti-sigma B factor antagonist